MPSLNSFVGHSKSKSTFMEQRGSVSGRQLSEREPVLASFDSNRNCNQQQVAVGRKRIGRLNIDADADEEFCKTCDLLRS